MDWLMVLNILRLLFAIIIMVFASYMDIKTRTIQNHLWIFFGLVGISLLEVQIVIEFGIENSFQHLILVIPLLILFMSFLICDYIYDRNGNKVNEPWLFLIALACFVFIFLTILNHNSSDNYISKIEITLPVILYILFFIGIQSLLNYMYHRAIIKVRKKQALPSKEAVETIEELTDPEDILEQRFSWALFFSTLGFIIIAFIMTEIIMMEIARIIGLIVLVVIPLLLIVLYFYYRGQFVSVHQNKENTDKTSTNENEIGEDQIMEDPNFVPPNPIIALLSFYGLIILGFMIILYYSYFELLSDFYVQIFILMIWIILLYGFYNVGIPKGGADTKALMALVILFPTYPIIEYITINSSFFELIEQFPVTGYIFPFMFSTLINAAFIMLFYVIILLLYNGAKHDLKFPHALLGYKLPIKEVQKKFVWLMERVEDGELRLIAFPKDMDQANIGKELKILRECGKTNVWVTPMIPFIIPLTIGLILATTIGNIIFLIIGLLM